MRMKTAPRRATNISLAREVFEEARELGVNLSQACEKGLVAEISVRRREKWLAENMDAIESNNAWIEEHGLPLAEYRLF
jgi:antitoxin CcdA